MDSITAEIPDSIIDAASLTSIHHNDLSRALVEAFLNRAARKDRDLAAMLMEYYDAALNPPIYDPDLSREERYEKDRLRTEALRLKARDLVDQLRYDPRLPQFADWNNKITWLADFVGPMLAKENYFDIAREIVDDFYRRRKEYYHAHKDEPGFNIDNFVFDSPYVPQFNERLFHPEDVNAVYNNLFGNGYVKWVFQTPKEFFEIIEQIRRYRTFTPHPIEGKSRAGNKDLIEVGNDVRTLAMLDKGGEFSRAAMREAGCEVTMSQGEFRLRTANRLIKNLDHLVNVEFTPLNADGNIRRFTVREEIEAISDSAEAAWTNGPLRYRTFERTLARTFDPELYPNQPDKHYTPEDRFFRLREGLGSWGPDKDGHEGKRHEHRIVEEVMRRLEFVTLAQAGFEELKKDGIVIDHPDYGRMEERLIAARRQLANIDHSLFQLQTDDGDVPLSQDEIVETRKRIDYSFTLDGEQDKFGFDQLREQLIAITERAALPNANWRDLSKEDQTIAWDKQTKALALFNNIRDFAPHLTDLEGRNNVEEFREVLAYILSEPHLETGAYLAGSTREEATGVFQSLLVHDSDDKAEASANDKHAVAFLDNLVISKPQEISDRVAAIRTRLESKELRDLGQIETSVCHTLNSIERALQEPAMYPNWVQAEYKGPKDTLVFVALQNGFELAPATNPIALVESLEDLDQIADYLDEMFFESKAFRQHMWRIADHENKIIDFILQFAHSDNTRTAGNIASRCALRLAHDRYNEWFKKNELAIKAAFKADGYDIDDYAINPVSYEGKSDHHVSRAGSRADPAMDDAYGTHKHKRKTPQGPDALLTGRFKAIAQREDSGFFSHSAKAVAWQEDTGESHNGFPEIENVVIVSGLQTKPDFEEHYYNSNKEKNLRGYAAACPAFDYAALGIVAPGSRPPKRGSKGAEETAYAHPEKGTVPIELMKIRAIGDVEHQFDLEIHGGWFAAKKWESYIYDNFHNNNPAFQDAGKGLHKLRQKAAELYNKRAELFDHDTQSLTTEGAVLLYKRSPMFRENIDIAGYGLMVIDLDAMEAKYAEAIERFGMPDLPQTRTYLNHLVEDAYSASCLVLKAFGIDPKDCGIDPKTLGINLLGEYSDEDRKKARAAVALARNLLKDANLPALNVSHPTLNLSHLNEELDPKRDTTHLSQRLFFEMNMEAWTAEQEAAHKRVAGQKDAVVDQARRNTRNVTRRHAWVARTAKSHGSAPITRDPPYKTRKDRYIKDHPERKPLRIKTKPRMKLAA